MSKKESHFKNIYLNYGPVVITKGKHKGVCGFYDDDEIAPEWEGKLTEKLINELSPEVYNRAYILVGNPIKPDCVLTEKYENIELVSSTIDLLNFQKNCGLSDETLEALGYGKGCW